MEHELITPKAKKLMALYYILSFLGTAPLCLELLERNFHNAPVKYILENKTDSRLQTEFDGNFARSIIR